MEMPAISSTFSLLGQPKAKFLTLVPFDALSGRRTESFRSLTLEHISPDALVHSEIQRRTPSGVAAASALQKQHPVPDEIILALLRRWFWSRRPDAGFLLAGFPARLLHAKIFDEWLEARGESLTAVVCLAGIPLTDDQVQVARHYREHGLLQTLAA
jgi:adenylate kinase